MNLHTVNKSSDCLQRCLDLAVGGDAVLLIEDGVYAAMANEVNQALWENASDQLSLYALESDLAARGLSGKMLPIFTCINWKQFVALTIEYDKVISWG